MVNKVSSIATKEFIMARCVEILADSDEHEALCRKVVELEKKLLSITNVEQSKIIMQISDTKEKLFCNDAYELYKSGFNDRLKRIK